MKSPTRFSMIGASVGPNFWNSQATSRNLIPRVTRQAATKIGRLNAMAPDTIVARLEAAAGVDPDAGGGVGEPQLLFLSAIAEEADDLRADCLPEVEADRIAQQGSEHGGDGAADGVAHPALGPGEAHRGEHHVGRYREEGAFRERHRVERRFGAAAGGEAHDPVVKSPKRALRLGRVRGCGSDRRGVGHGWPEFRESGVKVELARLAQAARERTP